MQDLILCNCRPVVNECLYDSCIKGAYDPGVRSSDASRWIGGWYCYSSSYGHTDMSQIELASDNSTYKFGSGSLRMKIKNTAVKGSDSGEPVANPSGKPWLRIGKYLPFIPNTYLSGYWVGGWFKTSGISSIYSIRFEIRVIPSYANSGAIYTHYATVEYCHSTGKWYYLCDDSGAKWSKDKATPDYLWDGTEKYLSDDKWYFFTLSVSGDASTIRYYRFSIQQCDQGGILYGDAYDLIGYGSALDTPVTAYKASTTYARLAKFQFTFTATGDYPSGQPIIYFNKFYSGINPVGMLAGCNGENSVGG